MSKKRKVASGARKHSSNVVTWKIEYGTYKPDGTHSIALRIIPSYRTEKEARVAWSDERQAWLGGHPSYAILQRCTQTRTKGVHTKWVEVRYTHGPFHAYQYGIYETPPEKS